MRLTAIGSLLLLACWLCEIQIGNAADLHVDPERGDDTADGVEKPTRTIERAIKLARPGDTIHLQPIRYRDWAPFFDKSGTTELPIILDGHGAVLDGCAPLDLAGWREVEPGLFCHDDLLPLTDAIVDRWFFVMNGRLNRMERCSKGPSKPLKAPDDLQSGEWTFVKDAERTKSAKSGYIFGTFWLRLAPDQKPAEAHFEYPLRPAGVLIRGTSSHLVIRNLTATRPYNDGFNLSDCTDVRFENIAAIDCGDDGISAHGACRYAVDRFASIGNATGICDTGTSETSYEHVRIQDCLGFDLFFLQSGDYRVKDAEVISSAARSLYLQGDPPPAAPCRVTLENVLIRRVGSPIDIRISENCELTARRTTFWNQDVQATGGVIRLEKSLIGGTVSAEPNRAPRLHLWKGAQWFGVGNWYDLESIRVGQESFGSNDYDQFVAAVQRESEGRWQSITSKAAPHDRGAALSDIPPRPKLTP